MLTVHPREVISLSGPWQIAFDPQDEGIKKCWPGEGWPDERSQPINVPEIWNIAYPDADGVGFYQTFFTVPGSWQGQACLLCFSGVIYRCEVWVNQQFAGGHEGGYTPFELDVTRFLRPGQENRLVVRVAALSKKKVVDGMQIQHAPLSKQCWYYVYGGIWGKVTLETRPPVACQSVSVNPDLARELAQLEICIRNRREECRQVELHLKIFDPRGALVHEQRTPAAAPPGEAHYQLHDPHPTPAGLELRPSASVPGGG